MPGNTFCLFHDPARAEQRDAARRVGGVRSRQRVAVLPADAADLPLSDVRDVASALADTFAKVRKGQLDPRVGNCLGQLLATMLQALKSSDLEERIAGLELRLAAQTNGASRRTSV
jgi:hypothetical protein